MAWMLVMIETLYEKCLKVMLWWHSLGVLFIVCVIIIAAAGGVWFLDVPVLQVLFGLLAIPWFLLVYSMILNYSLFGSNRGEMSQVGADAVVALLEEVGEPLHYREIHQKLEKPSVVKNDDDAMGLLLLFRQDPRLYSPSSGTYALVEWRESKRATDAVVVLLEEAGKPLHHHEIYQKLQDLDHQLAGGSSAQAITLLARQDPRLYSLRWGNYGLVEWQESIRVADADSVAALLKEAGKPLHYHEIHQKLEDIELWLPSGDVAARAFSVSVRNDPRLYSPRRDTYGLVEWREHKPVAGADAVVALLKEAGEPLHYHEIDQKLDELGLRLSGGGAARAINLLVQQDPRLYRLHWDTYGLVEWRESKPAADADAVVALLREVGESLRSDEIYQRLKDRGLQVPGGERSGGARAQAVYRLIQEEALDLLVQEDPRLCRLSWDTQGFVHTYGLVEWQGGKSDGAQAASTNVDRLPRKSESPTPRQRGQQLQESRRHAPLSGPLEVAYEVLRAEGRPLHYAELADRMLATGKWTTEAKSPSSTLNSYISKHISRHGDESQFFRASRGVYGLREWEDDRKV